MTDFELNGKPIQVDAPDETPLLWVLRDELGLTGTKYGCGKCLCGACTVYLDGTPARSCQLPLAGIAGKPDHDDRRPRRPRRHPVQSAWDEHQVVQCGYCQSGQVMAATALLTQNAKPDDAAIEGAWRGICAAAGPTGASGSRSGRRAGPGGQS